MGKDRENVFHPGKGKPSGANKQEPEIDVPANVHVRHPNRNTSKGEDFSNTEDESYKSRNTAFSDESTKIEAEEMPGILTKDMFTSLASHSGEPCISIYLATHPAGVEVNEQVDMIAFKNILQDIEKKLQDKNVDESLIKRLLKPAYNILRDDKFWYSMTEGLAVFIADGFVKYAKLRKRTDEFVHINSSFYVSPLVRFLVQFEYFYLLDIAKRFPRFYRADAFGIEHLDIEEMPTDVSDVVHTEEKEGHQLFRTGGKGGNGSANFHGTGDGNPDEKQHIAIYLKEVNDTIWASHLHKASVPLLLAGQDFLIPIFKSVSKYPHIWPEALRGNHHQQNDEELYQEAMTVMQPYFRKRRDSALEEYGNKLATALTSSMVDKIVPAAYYAQISVLFVRRGFRQWGLFDEQNNKLDLFEEEADGTADIIDKAVIKTIQNGGDVFYLDASDMPNNAEVAAILRY